MGKYGPHSKKLFESLGTMYSPVRLANMCDVHGQDLKLNIFLIIF